METTYSQSGEFATQKIKTIVTAPVEKVFDLIATNKGIQQWFPQLQLVSENGQPTELWFDLGDETYEKSKILNYKKPRKIDYEWNGGTVEFELENAGGQTRLRFTETLPKETAYEFIQDFAGWNFQLENIQSLAEHGELLGMDEDRFSSLKEEIQTKLD